MKNALKVFAAVIVVVLIFGAMAGGVWLMEPEKFPEPIRTTESASFPAKVAKVKSGGISVTLTNGKSLFLRGERGYTNGQPVTVMLTVYYIQRYKTIPAGVEWHMYSVWP